MKDGFGFLGGVVFDGVKIVVIFFFKGRKGMEGMLVWYDRSFFIIL